MLIITLINIVEPNLRISQSWNTIYAYSTEHLPKPSTARPCFLHCHA